MNPWIECSGRMPDGVTPDDEVVIEMRNGNQHKRRADECDWSHTPPMQGDIVKCRIVDPIDIIKETARAPLMPMDARNVYVVGPLALYVHDAPEDEIRTSLKEILKYLEVFITNRERNHAS